MLITAPAQNAASNSIGQPDVNGVQRQSDNSKRVTPVATSLSVDSSKTGAAPPMPLFLKKRVAMDGQAEAAPPSIMQIRISQMLNAQATAKMEKSAEAEAPEETEDTAPLPLIETDDPAAAVDVVAEPPKPAVLDAHAGYEAASAVSRPDEPADA